MRRREVVAAEARELEKLFGDFDANGMRADVLVARIAAAVAEKARLGPVVATLQRFTEHVDGRIHGRAFELRTCAERSAPPRARLAAASRPGGRSRNRSSCGSSGSR